MRIKPTTRLRDLLKQKKTLVKPKVAADKPADAAGASPLTIPPVN